MTALRPLRATGFWLVVAIVLSIASLAAGYWLFQDGRPRAAAVRPYGSVSLILDDPQVVADVTTDLEVDPPPEYADPSGTMDLDVLLKAPTHRTVGWMLLITGDFALPDVRPAYGRVASDGDASDLFDFESFDDESDVAAYVIDGGISDVGVHWTNIPGRSSLIFGVVDLGRDALAPSDVALPGADAPADPNHWSTEVTLRLPSPSLLSDSGDSVRTNLPIVGLPLPPSLDIGGSKAAYIGTPIDIYAEAPDDFLGTTLDDAWRYPTHASWTIWIEHAKSPAQLASAVPPPESPTSWIWVADDRLEVDATFVRPAVAAQRDTSLFFSGLVLGLAAGFLVWVFELLRDWSRQRGQRTADAEEA